MGTNAHFEGWYYRFAHPSTNESWVLIAAYWLDESGDSHAFLKLIHGPDGQSFTQEISHVDIKLIQSNEGYFSLQLGDLWLSAEAVSGSLTSADGQRVEFDLVIDGCAPWGAPNDPYNRWTMGWATNAPGIPLRWHVHHLKGNTNGIIRINESEWNMDQYSVHQEKNWGHAFPRSWIWFQANQFEGRPDVAFAAAGGPIFPFNFSPTGYMAGLRMNNEFYTWRSQDTHWFPQAEFRIDYERQVAVWRLVGESLRFKIEIDAEAPLEELIPIDVPTDTGLRIGAVEHLAASLSITLYRRAFNGWEPIDQARTSSAAIEVGGTLAQEAGLIE